MSLSTEDEGLVIRNDVNGMTKTRLLPHFVFVHGVCHGGWCWYKVRCLLESSGYKVTCIDLKSAGVDRSNPNSILTFDEYNKPLIDFLSVLPDDSDSDSDEKIILVGHSAGGQSVTDAIHKVGKKIHLAVYIAATMLRSGLSTEQDIKDGAPDVSDYGDVYDYEFELGPDQPPTSVIFKKEYLRQIVYQASPLEDSTLASMILKPTPIRALQGAKFTTEGDEVDKVARIYIKTAQDRLLKPEQQDAMIKRWPPLDVLVLESDHSPFFTCPFLLFDMLVKAVTCKCKCK